jgi:hypothetical protein
MTFVRQTLRQRVLPAAQALLQTGDPSAPLKPGS